MAPIKLKRAYAGSEMKRVRYRARYNRSGHRHLPLGNCYSGWNKSGRERTSLNIRHRRDRCSNDHISRRGGWIQRTDEND